MDTLAADAQSRQVTVTLASGCGPSIALLKILHAHAFFYVPNDNIGLADQQNLNWINSAQKYSFVEGGTLTSSFFTISDQYPSPLFTMPMLKEPKHLEAAQ